MFFSELERDWNGVGVGGRHERHGAVDAEDGRHVRLTEGAQYSYNHLPRIDTRCTLLPARSGGEGGLHLSQNIYHDI